MVTSYPSYFAIQVGCLLALDQTVDESQAYQEDMTLIHQKVGEIYNQMTQVVEFAW